ncbi:phosphoglucosamine mutase [bacterium]|nr:phosphoglucosamine mutase [bacterium]
MSKPVMISVSGIRGIVGEGLSPELVMKFAAAAGCTYGPGRVMVGRDSRVTGEMVKAAVFSGLMAVGCDPVDLGICSTPTVEMAVKDSDAVGGIIITASHNPVEWNALKLLTGEGIFMDANQGASVKKMIDDDAIAWCSWDKVGKISTKSDATQHHLDALLALDIIDIDAIKKRKFKVAYDCVNGAGGTILPQLFEALGCQTIALNLEPTGLFAHQPEPVPANLVQLAEAVKEHRADLGIAVDPDADRCALVAETGEPMGEEYTLAIAVKMMLDRKIGPVVLNLSTSRATEDIARSMGAEVIRTKVGEIHVAIKMNELDAVIGGEGNGGVILPDLHLGRDAPVAIALVLQALIDADKSISELWKSLPQYTMRKDKLYIGSSNPDSLLDRLAADAPQDRVSTLDGIKIDYDDYWVQIRKSNTEPIVRVMSEAKDSELAEQVCKDYLERLDKMMNT